MKQIRVEDQEKVQRILKETTIYIVICTVVVLVMTCVLSINYVPSESMEPTIHKKMALRTATVRFREHRGSQPKHRFPP